MTNLGELKQTEWIRLWQGDVRVSVRRGGGEEHEPFDEWYFDLRRDGTAVQLGCTSWIRDGKIDADWNARQRIEARRRRPRTRLPNDDPAKWRWLRDLEEIRIRPVVGAHLTVHRKAPDGEECPLLGRCRNRFAGFLNSACFFEGAHYDALAPYALRPVDEIDLGKVVEAMAPLWQKMAGYLAAEDNDE